MDSSAAPLPDDVIPFDENIFHGTLKNGLKYFVRKNCQPLKRADLKMVIKIGSIFEREEERGIAHMIEHLAFRATKDSKLEFETLKELETHGVQFGAHQNAYTSFDETVYELHIPTDVEGLMRKSLDVLRQLALEVRLSDNDVEKERSIVVEEWRQSRSGAQRAGDDYFQILTKGCLYCERLPIGLMDVINSVPAETVRNFYKAHYHPQLMAIVVVGDFQSEEEIVDMLTEIFEAVPQPMTPPKERPFIQFPSHTDPRVAVFTDPELTTTSCVFECVKPSKEFRTVAHYKSMLVMELFHNALSNRLQKLALCPNPPFMNASVTSHPICKEIASETISISCQESQILLSIESVWTEIERVRKFGFTEREIELAKSSMKSNLKTCYLEKDRTDSETLASEIKDHFVRDLPAPGIEFEYEMGNKLLDDINIEEVNVYVKNINYDQNCVVHLKTPESSWFSWLYALFSKVREHRIRQAITRGHSKYNALEEFEHKSSNSSIEEKISKLLCSEGKLLHSKVASDELGITEMELSNGMKVTVKPTDFQDDEVMLSAWAHGGLTELSKDLVQFVSGKFAALIAEELGSFGFPPATLLDLLSGKQVVVETEINAYGRSLYGESSVEDFETMLQLLHLLFVSDIQYDEERLSTIKRYMSEYFSLQDKNPRNVFSQMTDSLNTNNHYYFMRPNLEMLARVDFKEALEYFKRCFSNPAEFRLVIVGNISLSSLEELLSKYLASLPIPATPGKVYTHNSVTPLLVELPVKCPKTCVTMQMVDSVCISSQSFQILCGGGPHGTTNSRLTDHLLIDFVKTVLERRLLETLRFELGTIYTVSVGTTFSVADPVIADTDSLKGLLIVSFNCKPQDVERIHAKVLYEIKDLCTTGPKDEEVKNIIEAHRRERETAMRTNAYWLQTISSAYSSPRYQGDVATVLQENVKKMEELYSSLDAEMMRQAFSRFFGKCDCFTTSTLKAESSSKRLVKWTVLSGGVIAAVAVATFLLKSLRKHKL